MAEPTETRALPQRPKTMPGLQQEVARPDMARIPLPSPTPASPPRRPPPTITLPPLVAAQPCPVATVQPAPALATSGPLASFASTPRWFCWGLLGLSALIFLIQIWNYALS